MLVNLSSCDVVIPSEGHSEVSMKQTISFLLLVSMYHGRECKNLPLVVSEVEISLAAVVQHEHLSVPKKSLSGTVFRDRDWIHILSGGHGSGIDVHIRVDFDGGDSGTLSLQQQTGTRGWT